MPIYEVAGSQVVHFGAGDVLISVARTADREPEKGDNEIVFVRDTPHEIGAYTEEYKGRSSDTLDAPVRLLFERVESLDVLIERLQTLRNQMAINAN